MTTVSPWSRHAEPSPQQGVTLPQPPLPPPLPQMATGGRRARRRWPWIAGGVVCVIAAISGAAVISYAVSRNATRIPIPAPPSSAAPQFTVAEQAAAKDNLCRTFDMSVRGQGGQGGLRVNGELNVPVILRSINSAVVVENTLTAAVPQDVAAAARNYITTTLDQTTAAMGNTPTTKLNDLTDRRNDAVYGLIDACRLPR
jgi:hypothetical protein